MSEEYDHEEGDAQVADQEQASAEEPASSYDPTKDPGPFRPEDAVVIADDTPLSAEEVDPESQRMDESSSLAGDKYDNEGNRVT